MPHATSQPSADTTPSIRSKVLNRFYEPILVLNFFKDKKVYPSRQFSDDADTRGSLLLPKPEESFQVLVNKLAQICDSSKGGATVTAVSVVQLPDGVQYRLASNNRSEGELRATETYLKRVLNTLGDGPAGDNEADNAAYSTQLLRMVLEFNKKRLECYVGAILRQAPGCMNVMEHESSREADMLSSAVALLEENAKACVAAKDDVQQFTRSCETLIQNIESLRKTSVENIIRVRAREGQENQPESWAEFRHATGRLVSYLKAVNFLIRMRDIFPTLFSDFEIRPIPSSRPGRNPMSRTEHSISAIIGRMTADQTKMEEYRAKAEELQKFHIDEVLQKKTADKQKFKPIVHAEVLVCDSLDRDGLTRSSDFYRGFRYIGCSKPLCLLCRYYFEAKGCGMKLRASHNNLYYKWRVPDVDGTQAVSNAEAIINKMTGPIREQVFRTMDERVVWRKTHDSNTDPTYIYRTMTTHNIECQEDNDDLSSRIGRLDVEERAFAGVGLEAVQISQSRLEAAQIGPSPPALSGVKHDVDDSGDDEEDDADGGASLNLKGA